MKRYPSLRLLFLVALFAVPLRAQESAAPKGNVGDPLPSWNDGAARTAIITFVTKVTTTGLPTYIAPDHRIATFDNDGTLWAEQPIYTQIQFALDRAKEIIPDHPEWKEREPFKLLLEGDLKGFMAGGEKNLVEVLAITHTGMTTEEYTESVHKWLATARHPKTGRPYTEMVYQPMLELMAYLRANGFKIFIVSGGGVEFMRAFAQKVYGIPPEQVIGSRSKLKFEYRDGKPVLVKIPEIDLNDDKEGKPIGIQYHIGRRPLAAFGNSDGDLQMLQWTAAGTGVRFCLLVHHTDAEREWAYDRDSHIGKLDQAWDEAKEKGWTVVDMKKDWKTIFPAPPAPKAPPAPAAPQSPPAK